MTAERRLEKIIFWRSVALALGLHLALIAWIILFAPLKPEAVYKPLAVMDFMVYDPEGGEPGGVEEAAEPAPPEPEVAEPDPEPEEAPPVVESTAPEAEPLPAPPEKPKPKPDKSKPKPQPQPAAAPGPAEGAGQVGPGRGGEGGGTGQGTRDALRAYQSQIRRRLERNKKYPPAAQARKITGVASIAFTVRRNGEVAGVRLTSSSGHAVLDDEVRALLQRSAPLPPIPKEIPQDSLSIAVPIRFSTR
jgi:protein TonB